MTTTPKTETDAVLTAALWSVALAGIVLAVLSGMIGGGRALVGTAVGAAIATLNLWALIRLVRVLFNRQGPRLPWTLALAAKFALLLGGVFWLIRSELVDVLPLLAGYVALPVGTVAGQLRGAPPAREEA
jgi:ATP synthase I subunit